jgi:proteasome lid subunit RPN8/RPN11
VSPQFTAATYNVLKHNCNNFSDECAKFLLGTGIPKDIVNLPNEFLSTPMGRMLAPMMQQAQDNLKVNSHQLFDDGGH